MQKTEHTKDTLLDYAASNNTLRNEDTDGAHTADPPMDDTAHGSTRRIHCWTTQPPTTHQGMRMQMEHTPRIHPWMTLHTGANKDTLMDSEASNNTPRNEDTDGAHSADPPMDDTAHGSTRRIHC
uniref:Uncharacterized protein LOC111111299 n=1 Tax=Crassostrea virginica TaxID=6565 RepID=A0A8B8BKR0_CRAVI|nr:uncharacterized protein LOC111111299 [Crassostrea virginica]